MGQPDDRPLDASLRSPSERVSPASRILVVDDEPGARSALTELLRDEGYDVHAAADGFKALGRLDTWDPDLVITDLKMPGMDGVELMNKVRERVNDVGVVVMTAFGSVESAVQAMREGADDYLTKPLHLGHLLVVIERVLEHRSLRRDAERMRQALGGDAIPETEGMVGVSKPFRDLLDLVRQVAESDASVLVTGEIGTGKHLVARVLHESSPRADKPFVSVNCSAPSESLLEVELFGRSAPDGAVRSARLEQADGGTMFLEEVADMPPPVQVKLLSFIQDGTYEPVGGGARRPASVRVVAASNRDLLEEVRGGRFREDLYYRLNVISLRVPTLRERREDISLLATHFLQAHVKKSGKAIVGFTERALGVLVNFDWPGNIRQLENAIERAVVLCDEPEIEPRHLPRSLMVGQRPGDELPQVPGATLRELERFAILKTLEHVGGSTSKAARILGISPRKIQYRLNEYRDTDADARDDGPAVRSD